MAGRLARTLCAAAGACLVASVGRAGEVSPPAGERERESYAVGYEIGASVRRQGLDVDVEGLLAAARAGLEGRDPAIAPAELRETLVRLRKKAIIAEDLRYRERAAKNLEEGRRFLAANASREGVRTRPSGLQYLVVAEGTGASPRADEAVKVHYRGTLVDGTEFDDTRGDGPAVVEPDQMMPAWEEALPLMKAGAKWRLFVPAELGYGDRPFGRIPPNSALVFDVELLGVGPGLLAEAGDGADDSVESGPASGADGAGAGDAVETGDTGDVEDGGAGHRDGDDDDRGPAGAAAPAGGDGSAEKGGE